MQELIQAMITGVTAFAATNIDDLLILVLLFAQINSQDNSQDNSQTPDQQLVNPQEIIIGKYLGFGVLILASLPGFVGGFVVPRPWLGWLGLVPMAIGISHLLQNSSTTDNTQEVQAVTNQAERGKRQGLSRFTKFINPQIYQVAAVTVGNGGDNIGIYVPLFANSNLSQLLVILGIFLVMIAVWCGVAYALTRHPLIIKALARYGQAIVPLVLIALGIYIFMESETYKLLGIGI